MAKLLPPRKNNEHFSELSDHQPGGVFEMRPEDHLAGFQGFADFGFQDLDRGHGFREAFGEHSGVFDYDRLCAAIVRREMDVVMAWSVDRLGRSLQHLVGLLSDLQAKGVDLYLHQQGIDTTTAAGKAMFQMCGVFAEFERAMIRERVKAGLERVRAQGKTLGRPRTSASMEQKIQAARRQGKGIQKIAKELGIGVSAVQRVVHGRTP